MKDIVKEISREELDIKCQDAKKQGDQFILLYHIDTEEGLNKFVEIIKNIILLGRRNIWKLSTICL